MTKEEFGDEPTFPVRSGRIAIVEDGEVTYMIDPQPMDDPPAPFDPTQIKRPSPKLLAKLLAEPGEETRQ